MSIVSTGMIGIEAALPCVPARPEPPHRAVVLGGRAPGSPADGAPMLSTVFFKPFPSETAEMCDLRVFLFVFVRRCRD